MKTTRRTHLKQVALGTAATGVAGWPVLLRGRADEEGAQPRPTESEATAMAGIAREAMEKHESPGLSVAIARHGQLVYEGAFGLADKEKGAPVTASSLFRIASVSKPITSVAVFTLIEQGRLGLEKLVFGAEGILKFDYADSYPERVGKINVRHLLTHTCGGWDNGDGDPMFQDPRMDHKELIRWAIRERPLGSEPGAHYAYSNFGYCLLGRVIEKVARQPYADFVRKAVLARCGVKDMRVGGSTLAQRAPGEVVYYGHEGSGTNPYDMNITRMDSHGGWIATPADMVRFAMHVDGFKTTPNILGARTIETMTTCTAANANYACGWFVNKVPNWWHTGSLPGTQTILVRTASGLCWAACANTRNQGLNLDEMMWKMARAVPAWHA